MYLTNKYLCLIILFLLYCRRPLYTFYQTWCDVHMDYGNTTIQDDFSYQRLRHSWNCYLQLLDVDLNTGFSCPDCGGDDETPDTIICDGTALSFQRRMWEWCEEKDGAKVLKLATSK